MNYQKKFKFKINSNLTLNGVYKIHPIQLEKKQQGYNGKWDGENCKDMRRDENKKYRKESNSVPSINCFLLTVFHINPLFKIIIGLIFFNFW